MKKIIKSIIIPVLIAILFGYISGKYLYKTYKDNLYNNLKSSKLYLIENGKYYSVTNMREENSNNNYVYYKDNNIYKTINIPKIKSLYSNDLTVEEYYIKTDNIDKKQLEYEKILSSTNDKQELKDAVDNILNLYKNDNTIRLIQLN